MLVISGNQHQPQPVIPMSDKVGGGRRPDSNGHCAEVDVCYRGIASDSLKSGNLVAGPGECQHTGEGFCLQVSVESGSLTFMFS